MEIEFLKRIIEDQREEIEEKFASEKIVERELVEYGKRFLKHPNILAILGVRRCGKSILSFILARKVGKKFGYVNFDDERLIRVKTEDLDKILQCFYELYGEDVDLVILDEIQNVYGWELFANRLRRTKKVILTESNSKLLSGELATHLTGRHIDIILYPFSFKEVLEFIPNIYSTKDITKVRKKLKEYVQSSGFPEVRTFGPNVVVKIYEDIINKDCIRRYKIKNEESFRELASYLVSNFSNEFTYSKLLNICKIKDVHTVKNYVNYLKEAYLIIVLDRYSPKLKQQILAPKKVYNVDHGLCNFVSFRISKDIGKIFENIVCVELMREKTINYDMEIYYWKDYQQNEVDFVVRRKAKVDKLIQVCYDVEEKKEKEVRSLIKASKELKCNDLLVITNDYETEEKINEKKIKFVPLWKWLLVKG